MQDSSSLGVHISRFCASSAKFCAVAQPWHLEALLSRDTCHLSPVTNANSPGSEHRQFQVQAFIVENYKIFFHRNQIALRKGICTAKSGSVLESRE